MNGCRPWFLKGKGEQELDRHARLSSHRSIRDDGRRRVLAGDTALAELVRVTPGRLMPAFNMPRLMQRSPTQGPD